MFFYQLGQRMNTAQDGLLLQRWSRRLGVGRKTGIDLPDELPGRIPTPKWRDRGYAQFQRCKERKKPTDAGDLARASAASSTGPGRVGDNINLSVGQGDIAANPLQMAVAYAAVANGGRVLRPRLGLRIEDASGRALQQLEAPTARRRADLGGQPAGDPRRALWRRQRPAAAPRRRSSRASRSRSPARPAPPRRGSGRADQSWYVALAPYPNPQYVVAVTDEAGGFGADTAAPMARLILAELFNVDENRLVAGGDAPD